jgi:hypothetical protein
MHGMSGKEAGDAYLGSREPGVGKVPTLVGRPDVWARTAAFVAGKVSEGGAATDTGS